MIDDLLDIAMPECVDEQGRVYVMMKPRDPQPYCSCPELECFYLNDDLGQKHCEWYKYDSIYEEMKK